MELKKKFIGSFIFDKEFNRKIEIKEENKESLLKFKHLFNDIPKKKPSKRNRSNSEGDDNSSES